MFCSHCGERVSPLHREEVILRLSRVEDPAEDIVDKFKATEAKCSCGYITYGQRT